MKNIRTFALIGLFVFIFTDEQIRISPAYSGTFNDINANIFNLEFYPTTFISAAVLVVIAIAVKSIANAKTKQSIKGAKSNEK